MLRIDKVKFGTIKINDKEYHEDVIVTNDSVRTKESSHKITKEEIEDVLLLDPDIIIIGTGTSGMVKVPQEVRDIVEREGKEIIIGKTPEVVNQFNKLRINNKIVGIFHITC